MATTNDIGSAVDALLGTQSCAPQVGVPTCRTCGGCGIVDTGRGCGDDIRTETCDDCEGTGYRSLSDEESASERAAARARCAAILNARAKEQP